MKIHEDATQFGSRKKNAYNFRRWAERGDYEIHFPKSCLLIWTFMFLLSHDAYLIYYVHVIVLAHLVLNIMRFSWEIFGEKSVKRFPHQVCRSQSVIKLKVYVAWFVILRRRFYGYTYLWRLTTSKLDYFYDLINFHGKRVWHCVTLCSHFTGKFLTTSVLFWKWKMTLNFIKVSRFHFQFHVVDFFWKFYYEKGWRKFFHQQESASKQSSNRM